MVTSVSDLSTRRKAAGMGYITTSTTLSSTEGKGWPSLGWANPVTTSLRDLAIYPSRKQRLHLQIKNEDLHAQPTRHYTDMKVPQTERAGIIHTGTWEFFLVWLFFSCSDTICWTGQTSNNDLFPHNFFFFFCIGLRWALKTQTLNSKPQLKDYELAWSFPRVRRQPKCIIECSHK